MLLIRKYVYSGLGLLALLIVLIATQWNTPEWAGARIASKNVEARGGLSAWRQIHSMSLLGKLDAGKVRTEAVKVNLDPREAKAYAREAALKVLKGETADSWKTVQLPYSLELQRPRKSRLEIEFNGEKALQVYDGEHGWKLRPFLGRKEVEPYTAEENTSASSVQALDGYLIDYSAKKTKVELEGNEAVEGHDAFKLKLTLKDGQVRYIWVDAQSYLELKLTETPMVNGKAHTLTTYFRDYQTIDGLRIPHFIETQTEQDTKSSEKILIEKVVLNPEFNDYRFTKPDLANNTSS
jgi:hypothetical protein